MTRQESINNSVYNKMMTENEMMEALEKARQHSVETCGIPVYALSNGKNIVAFTDIKLGNWKCSLVERYENNGYWVASIFEDGHRVEA
jgi:hypothetical protein